MAPRRATGRKLERHKAELQKAIFIMVLCISEKIYTCKEMNRSSKNLLEIKFFTSGKICLLCNYNNVLPEAGYCR